MISQTRSMMPTCCAGVVNAAKACLDGGVSRYLVISSGAVSRPDSFGYKVPTHTSLYIIYVYVHYIYRIHSMSQKDQDGVGQVEGTGSMTTGSREPTSVVCGFWSLPSLECSALLAAL